MTARKPKASGSRPSPGKAKTRGDRNIAWIETHCRIPEGRDVGKPVRLRDWQKADIRKIYDNPHGTRRAIISFGRKNAKALALDTPIPTPGGWRTIGDIQPGDFVLGSSGKAVEILAASKVFVGKKCYAVGFSDGSSVVASEDHLWTTRHRYRPWAMPRRNGSGNGGRYRTGTLTTAQIAGSIKVPGSTNGEFNHKLHCAPALEVGRSISPPIPPYAFGAWLGDGTSSCANITVGEIDEGALVSELETEIGNVRIRRNSGGRATTICLTSPRGSKGSFQSRLRELGVLRNKHIPESYLAGDEAQRWALLQGLMDTDGTVDRCGGQTTARCSFSNCNYRLAYDTWRLARSLGLKASIREGVATIDGCVIGASWKVAFAASKSSPVFRLNRKQSLLPDALGKRCATLSIVSCEEVESVPTRCLMVDAPDKLFLVGHGCVPTHNTTLAAFLLLLHTAGPEAKANSQLNSAAQSKDQAAILFKLAAKIVRLSPTLHPVCIIRDTFKELACPELGTLYKALSAEASTAYGLSPVFIVHDELGQVKGPRSELYDALETAVGAHENPLSIIISTQAPTDADLLSVLIDDALAGSDPRVVLSLYTADQDIDPFDQGTIKQANPAFGDFLNAKEVLAMAEDARRMPNREAEYRNLVLNQRVEASSPFITRSVWMANAGEVVDSFDGLPVYGGLDLSETNDLTALVLIAPWRGVWHVKPTFWLPADGLVERSRRDRVPYDQWAKEGHMQTTPGKSIEYEFVAEHLRGIFDRYDIRQIAFDRWNFKHLRPWLIQAGFTDQELEAQFEEFGQGTKSMSPALRDTESDLLNSKFAHGAHPVLTMCFANAVVDKDAAGGRKLTKAKSRGRIDGAVSLVMARSVAATHELSFDAESWIASYA